MKILRLLPAVTGLLMAAPLLAAPPAYPYHASAERRTAILDGVKRLKPGMSAAVVRKIMGRPDEVNDTFEPKVFQPRKTGYSYVYLLQRIHPDGSAARKDEKLVRLQFGQDDKLLRSDDQSR